MKNKHFYPALVFWGSVNFESLRWSIAGTFGGQQLKKGDAYFKEKRTIQMEFQYFVIVFFQVTINNYHYDI